MSPERNLNFFMLILLALIVVLLPEAACAASGADSDIIANVVKEYKTQQAQIIAVVTKYAKSLFYLCAVLDRHGFNF